MQKNGLTFADLESQLGGRGRGRKSVEAKSTDSPVGAAKYADPKTGATWTGHGRAPAWIANAKDRSRFLIDGSAQRLPKTASSAAKSGNYVRGPQAPKYRDPQSRATWSGRGRAPAWMVDVRDRTTFPIEGKGDVAPKAVATKAVVAKKATAKKGTARKAVTGKAAATKVVTNEATAKKRVGPAKK
jgi:DNA-binding protein H-NS